MERWGQLDIPQARLIPDVAGYQPVYVKVIGWQGQ